MTLIYPIIGNWYKNSNEMQLFEVVAIDEKNGTIEVQYEGGEIGEFDFDSWKEMMLTAAAQPEDGNAAYGFSAEEYWMPDECNIVPEMENPLEYIEPEAFDGFDDN